jgi:hypothetical protein
MKTRSLAPVLFALALVGTALAQRGTIEFARSASFTQLKDSTILVGRPVMVLVHVVNLDGSLAGKQLPVSIAVAGLTTTHTLSRFGATKYPPQVRAGNQFQGPNMKKKGSFDVVLTVRGPVNTLTTTLKLTVK